LLAFVLGAGLSVVTRWRLDTLPAGRSLPAERSNGFVLHRLSGRYDRPAGRLSHPGQQSPFPGESAIGAAFFAVRLKVRMRTETLQMADYDARNGHRAGVHVGPHQHAEPPLDDLGVEPIEDRIGVARGLSAHGGPPLARLCRAADRRVARPVRRRPRHSAPRAGR